MILNVTTDVKFPLFVLADDRSMCLIESPDRLLYHLEAIDIENGEYLFWDSTGAGVCVTVAHGALNQIVLCDHAMSLAEAFEAYARSYGLQIPLGESPFEIWTSLQSQLPPRKTLWARLFHKSKA